MRRIKWKLSIGIAGGDIEDEFEVDDDTSDEDIEDMAKECALSNIDWRWEEEAE